MRLAWPVKRIWLSSPHVHADQQRWRRAPAIVMHGYPQCGSTWKTCGRIGTYARLSTLWTSLRGCPHAVQKLSTRYSPWKTRSGRRGGRSGVWGSRCVRYVVRGPRKPCGERMSGGLPRITGACGSVRTVRPLRDGHGGDRSRRRTTTHLRRRGAAEYPLGRDLRKQ